MPEAEKKTPVIALQGVSKVYTVGTEKVRALDDVSLTIDPGEFVCVVGRSGSGKSTLLNMMAGLEPPSRGHIRVAGRQIERLSEDRLVEFRLRHVGFVFQSFNLFPTHTALDNVAMPLMYRGVSRGQRLRKAREMLSAVGLLSHKDHKPTEMSGGQQQRVGIARALAGNPEILFADEPTGNLDSNTSREILELIRDICKKRGATLVVVTHDPGMADYADHVIRLLDGKIEEDIRKSGTDADRVPAEEDYPG